jgi:tRNA-dihydrouridine synthase 2
LKPEDLAAHLEKRHKRITGFFTAWDESTMLQDFDDQPTPKRPAEQQQQQQLETKRQKKQRKKKNKNNAFDKRRESVKA